MNHLVELDLVKVKVKVLKKFSTKDEHSIVFVTFYDSEGKEVATSKVKGGQDFYSLAFVQHDETLYRGEIKTYTFLRGDKNERPSYKVWLYVDEK